MNTYRRTTKEKMTFSEIQDFKYSQKMHFETPGCVLLDSSLNIQGNKYLSSIKIVKCNNIYQLYYYPQETIKNNKNLEPINIDELFKSREV